MLRILLNSKKVLCWIKWKHGPRSSDCMQVKGAMKPPKRKEIKDSERAMGPWNLAIPC